ncbi:hypothetical protein [Paenirhodobacter sp.]|uniref:hypothetical protein n=1 Tax=Paenirhodobacter sp. TaxID=1965326 RepID=UPI003B3DC6B2
MNFFKLVRRIRGEEGGVVIIDWVVLAAVLVGLGALAMIVFTGDTSSLSDRFGDELKTDMKPAPES